MKLLVRLLVAVVVAVGLAGPVGPAAAASTGAAGLGIRRSARWSSRRPRPSGTPRSRPGWRRSSSSAPSTTHGRRDRGRRGVHRREPRPVRRGDLAVHHGRRAERHAAGGLRALHPPAAARGHPLRLGHRVRLGLVRRAGRGLLPRPPGLGQRPVPGGDREGRRTRHRRHRAPAESLGAEEEWYNFRNNPRHTVRVLAEVDESTYDPRGYSVPGGSPGMGQHHPISWCQPYDGGRAFYTAMGHKAEYYLRAAAAGAPARRHPDGGRRGEVQLRRGGLNKPAGAGQPPARPRLDSSSEPERPSTTMSGAARPLPAANVLRQASRRMPFAVAVV